MAKNKNGIDLMRTRDPAARRIRNIYTLMGLIYLIFVAFNMVIENLVYVSVRDTYRDNTENLTLVSQIKENFATVNQNILITVSVKDEEILTLCENRVANAFNAMDEEMTQFLNSSDHAEALRRRFEHATYAISNYKGKLANVQRQMETATPEEATVMYQEQLAPLQETANEMLAVVIELGQQENADAEYRAAYQHGAAQGALVVMTIIIFATMFYLGTRQITDLMEIQKQQKEINEASARLTKSRKKLIDSAMTNILTGMKNRYALDESLAQLISNAQFNIAVFDIDNFRMINDMYGYEFGDEYLATVAERLKTDYSEHAEMFNITGNEFCMIFYEHISDLQAQQLAEQIRQSIGQPMTLAGIEVRTTVSASLYHYLPSDNLDVNTLLMKMDTALHAAKHDGGNRMYQIQ